jgi:hypothetical protein
MNNQPSPTPQKTSVAPPKTENNEGNSIGYLVMLCSTDIAKCHECAFTDPSELTDRLLKNPNGNFRTDFETLYIATNLRILQNEPDLEIEHNGNKVNFIDLSMDIEQWLTMKEYMTDATPGRALREGELLFKLYTRMLVKDGQYNPAEV